MKLEKNLYYSETIDNNGVINANDCVRNGVVVDDSPILSENTTVISDKVEILICDDLIFEVSMDDAIHVRSMTTDEEKITYLLNKGYSGNGAIINGYYRK